MMVVPAQSGNFQIVGRYDPNWSPYRAATDFIRGRFWVEGDLIAAVRAVTAKTRPALENWLTGLLVQFQQCRPVAWLRGGRHRTAGDIRFHYDRSNEFYKQFLDSRMVYSCAYFRSPRETLEDAQVAKLDLICRKLDLQQNDRFLDVGCGWGALLQHASENYGACATGCTISHEQAKFSKGKSSFRVVESLYDDLTGSYDKIASVGMFEHVGKARLASYFQKMHSLLQRDGLFLNHGIVRRAGEGGPNGESLFLQQHVFPGTSMVYLTDVIQTAESSGFEVLDIENLRPHYSLTCRAWVENLQKNAETCRQLVGEEIYRTWLLYLAGSAVNFEDGHLDVHQILLARKDSRTRPLSRDYQFMHRMSNAHQPSSAAA